MIRSLLALSLLACSAELRPPMPDLAPTLAQLDRIERWAEERQDQPCSVPMRVDFHAECYYPQRIPVVQVAGIP